MTAPPEECAETPGDDVARVLEDVLGVVRLSGSLILRADFSAPWAYESPAADALRGMLRAESQRLILFHCVPEGRCSISLADGQTVALAGGDVVVLPYADQHWVQSPDPCGRHVSIGTLLPPQPWRTLPHIRYGGGGVTTRFVCGYLLCDDLLFDPFLRALPRLFSVRPPEGPAADWLRATLRYALEGASPAAAQRLHGLIFVEVLRLYMETLAPHQTGWLAGLADPLVGKALVHLHAAPEEDWTVARLAARVGASRSVLDDRFRRLLGRPPMRYLTEWRLQLAAHLLRTTALGLAEIADRVGYESETSFNRAFRRTLGHPPARWRAAQRLTAI
jgi:AraC-like DNA-binding protein